MRKILTILVLTSCLIVAAHPAVASTHKRSIGKFGQHGKGTLAKHTILQK